MTQFKKAQRRSLLDKFRQNFNVSTKALSLFDRQFRDFFDLLTTADEEARELALGTGGENKGLAALKKGAEQQVSEKNYLGAAEQLSRFYDTLGGINGAFKRIETTLETQNYTVLVDHLDEDVKKYLHESIEKSAFRGRSAQIEKYAGLFDWIKDSIYTRRRAVSALEKKFSRFKELRVGLEREVKQLDNVFKDILKNFKIMSVAIAEGDISKYERNIKSFDTLYTVNNKRFREFFKSNVAPFGTYLKRQLEMNKANLPAKPESVNQRSINPEPTNPRSINPRLINPQPTNQSALPNKADPSYKSPNNLPQPIPAPGTFVTSPPLNVTRDQKTPGISNVTDVNSPATGTFKSYEPSSGLFQSDPNRPAIVKNVELAGPAVTVQQPAVANHPKTKAVKTPKIKPTKNKDVSTAEDGMTDGTTDDMTDENEVRRFTTNLHVGSSVFVRRSNGDWQKAEIHEIREDVDPPIVIVKWKNDSGKWVGKTVNTTELKLASHHNEFITKVSNMTDQSLSSLANEILSYSDELEDSDPDASLRLLAIVEGILP